MALQLQTHGTDSSLFDFHSVPSQLFRVAIQAQFPTQPEKELYLNSLTLWRIPAIVGFTSLDTVDCHASLILHGALTCHHANQYGVQLSSCQHMVDSAAWTQPSKVWWKFNAYQVLSWLAQPRESVRQTDSGMFLLRFAYQFAARNSTRLNTPWSSVLTTAFQAIGMAGVWWAIKNLPEAQWGCVWLMEIGVAKNLSAKVKIDSVCIFYFNSRIWQWTQGMKFWVCEYEGEHLH